MSLWTFRTSRCRLLARRFPLRDFIFSSNLHPVPVHTCTCAGTSVPVRRKSTEYSLRWIMVEIFHPVGRYVSRIGAWNLSECQSLGFSPCAWLPRATEKLCCDNRDESVGPAPPKKYGSIPQFIKRSHLLACERRFRFSRSRILYFSMLDYNERMSKPAPNRPTLWSPFMFTSTNIRHRRVFMKKKIIRKWLY